jgi:hypothetical protein
MALPVWARFLKILAQFSGSVHAFWHFFEFWQHFAAELQKLHSFSHLQPSLK